MNQARRCLSPQLDTTAKHSSGSMSCVLQRHYTPDDMPHRSELEHRAILAAIEARDVRGARKAMKAHLDEVIAIFTRAQ
ncbi:hypothetical protein BHU62_08170 [Serratia marcescens]|uniref:GntR C-terminal domain-containing protein n=1 Tax=Serratia marcescens TaxID=615 RepID=A0A1Q4P2V6_SERMA|nr:FCD domain-containing protein [Serratia marcescens]OKB67455.1 hypothetical protein BHU62_08170 [Serratia marcescens]